MITQVVSVKRHGSNRGGPTRWRGHKEPSHGYIEVLFAAANHHVVEVDRQLSLLIHLLEFFDHGFIAALKPSGKFLHLLALGTKFRIVHTSRLGAVH